MTIQTLEQLQAQLATLQQQNAELMPQAPVKPKVALGIPNETLIALIDERINQKLATVPKPGINDLSVLVGGHLEQDEIAWLVGPGVSDALPAFLSSASGHEYVRLFFTEFKEFYESKTRNTTK